MTPAPVFDNRPVVPQFGVNADRGTSFRSGVTWAHTMVGTLWGTDAYFRLRGTPGLTHWGIGGLLDGIHDGKIIRWVDIKTAGFGPYASGPYIPPGFGDMPQLVKALGTRVINYGGDAIEMSGMQRTPVTLKQWLSFIHLSAFIKHDAGYDSERELWTMEHVESCGPAYKQCPWGRVSDFVTEYRSAIVRVMAHFEGKKVSPFINVGGHRLDLDTVFSMRNVPVVTNPGPLYVSDPRTLTVGRGGGNGRQYGNIRSVIRRVARPGEKIRVQGYYLGEYVAGDNRWFVADDGKERLRYHASVFTDSPRMK